MEKKIISASRRTDIPAFYSKWFINRIKEGYCNWANPFSGKIYKVSLLPEEVLAIVFWTRFPAPLLKHISSLKNLGYKFYFHFTINDYPKFLEPHAASLKKAIESFERLSESISPQFIFWRYDPILFSEKTPAEYHLEKFGFLARKLKGYTHRSYFSFATFYKKTKRSLKEVEKLEGISFKYPSSAAQKDFSLKLRKIAEENKMSLYSCCDDKLVGSGIYKAHCVDLEVIKRLRPDLKFDLSLKATRKDCGCYEAVDIGAYDTCIHGCRYCYANIDRKNALKRFNLHKELDSIIYHTKTKVCS